MIIRLKKLYIPHFLVSIFAFLVGFGGVKLPFASAIFAIGWLIDIALNYQSLLNDRKAFVRLYLPVLLLFAFSAFSLFYSNFDVGMSVLERRMWFLLFPIMSIVGFSRRINFNNVLAYYVWGVVLAMLYLILHLFIDNFRLVHINILIRQDFFNVFMDYIRHLQHRTYLGMNIAIAMCLLYGYFKIPKVRMWGVLLIMALFVLCTGARAASLTVLGLLFFFILNTLYNSSRRKLLFLVTIGGVVGALLFVYYYPRMWNAILKGVSEDDSRLSVWLTTLDLLKDHWLSGFGIGDFFSALIDKYKSVGAKYALQYQLDPHNQYLYILGEIGVVGLILLGWIFVGFVSSFRKQKRFIPFTLVFVFVLNFMFESVLLRIWGIASFVVVFFLFRLATVNADNNQARLNLPYLPSILFTSAILLLSLFVFSTQPLEFNSKDPYTYAQSKFEAVTEFPGVLPEGGFDKSVGYLLNSSASTMPARDNIHRTKLGEVLPGVCDSVELSVYCYVTEDFSGASVFAGGYAKMYGAKAFYDLSKKGTWQWLHIKTVCPEKKVLYFMHMEEAENKDISDLLGYVIFVNPVFRKIQ